MMKKWSNAKMNNIIFSSEDIIIRAMEEKHIDMVANIDCLSFTTPWSRESFQNEISVNALSKYVVALKDDLVVGYGGLWLIVNEGHITNIAVHPEFRGVGIGNMLVDALIQVCKENNVISMTLEVRVSNKAAIGLYEKYGFVVEGVRKEYYGDNKEDGLVMWKHFL